MRPTKHTQIHLSLIVALLSVSFLVACSGALSPEPEETVRDMPASAEATSAEVAYTEVPSPAVAETASEETVEPPQEGDAAGPPADEPLGAPALDLPDMGPAPEIENEVWLNSEPLRLAELKGKVVLLEFWTFGCINCQRVTPYVREWHDKYAGDEFVVLTVHYPEFGYEENLDNVREALDKNEIEYAVAIDNDGLTWRAYNQRYWPTRYLIDKEGHIRYKHIGEGGYETTEVAIQQLIAEPLSP